MPTRWGMPTLQLMTPGSMLARTVPSGACRIWTGAKAGPGYGSIWHNGKVWNAHRLMYVLVYGPPKGNVLHRCGNKACIEPTHLYDGTQKQNAADAMAAGWVPGWQQFKTRCKRNHPLSGSNLYVTPDGRRMCKACQRERKRRYRRAH